VNREFLPLEELEESFSWLGPFVLLPAAGGEAAPPVPLAAVAPASARGRLWRTQRRVNYTKRNFQYLFMWENLKTHTSFI